MSLVIVPISFRSACAFIAALHRHNKPPRGMKFAIGCADETGLRGVATAGRPIARSLDDGLTLEINRTCTDGCPNANSFLYGAARRIAHEMGYQRVITYTEEGESGASLRAAGFRLVAELEPRRNWAESSVKLRDLRDGKVRAGVRRYRWESSRTNGA